MSRRPLVAGNWKLHCTVGESVALARAVGARVGSGAVAEVVVAPVFTALHAVRESLGGSEIGVAAQDCYWESKGAFTGEVSVPLLADVGCAYVIVGHSERRQYFGEVDETVGRKTRAALAGGLRPIVCIGETLAQRESGETESVVLRQLDGALAEVEQAAFGRVVVAYEPVWAIGTGRNATKEDAQAVHVAIRGRLGERFGASLAAQVRILYGGSVKPENARELLSQPDIDGALVGGASLTAESFCAIVESAA